MHRRRSRQANETVSVTAWLHANSCSRIDASMKRSWNGFVWAGFAVVLLAVFSFVFLIRFPATRDFPWVNLLLFAAGALLLAAGLRRAFLQSDRYRGKVSGPILSLLSLAMFGLFCY